MDTRTFLIFSRLGLGSLALLAIIVQAVFLQTEGLLNPFNYLGYFTNISNIFASVVFIFSALYLVKHRKPSPRDDIIRGAATLYMAVTGLVYVTLLSGEDLGLLMPWVNIVTHIIMPVAVIADWLFQPPLSKITFKRALLWLIFPGVYLVYSLIRGSIVGWYPYPFLNPEKVDGYGGVAVYCAAILVAFLALGWLLGKFGSMLKRRV
ncbi:MAG TPA: Pr6Pr family membrane protein [Candidatus Saccharimonadales bacterium]|nr:Pr6Pr family membrane protein [Candidatus Saccharimonadales bacterium]